MALADVNGTPASDSGCAPEDPLQMASNLVAAVARLGEQASTDPHLGYASQAGARAAASAAMAAQLATVSIARDVRRIADATEHRTATERAEDNADTLALKLAAEARRHSTPHLLDTYAQGVKLHNPWPTLMTAIELVLAERDVPLGEICKER